MIIYQKNSFNDDRVKKQFFVIQRNNVKNANAGKELLSSLIIKCRIKKTIKRII